MTYESVSKTQADLMKYMRSTTERKIMSTKTSIKRIALVAVAALGFGMVSTVSAKAANIISVPTAVLTSPATTYTGGTSAPIPQGTKIELDLKLDQTAVYTDAGDGTDVTYVITDPQNNVITSSATFTAVAAPVAGVTATASGAVISVRSTGAGGDITSNPVIGHVVIPASATTIAGAYTITSTIAAVNGAGGTTDTDTTGQMMDGTTSVARGLIYVSGTSVTQGTSRGYNGAATVGNVATVTWFTPLHTASSVYRIIPSGVGSVSAVAQGTGTATSITPISGVTGNWNSGAIYTTAAATTTESATISLTSTTAGDQTVNVYTVDGTTGLLTLVATSYVRWGAAQVATASTSKAYLAAGTTCATANDTLPVRIAKTASTAVQATICLTINDADGVAANGVPVSVTVSGPGLVSLTEGTGTTANAAVAGTVRAVSKTATAMSATNRAIVGISADGTAGTSTITVTAGTATFTKTVYFYGTVATLTATQNLKIARAGSLGYTLGCALNACDSSGNVSSQTLGTPAVSIVAKDADGNVVPGLTITAVSSDATVIGSANIVEANGAPTALDNSAAGPGTYLVSVVSAPGGVSGKTATVTFRTMKSDGTYISTSALPFSLGGSRTGGTVTIALDKASYAPGEKMVLTYTAKDSSGNPVYDGTTAPSATASKAVTGSLDGVQFIDGKAILGDEAGENIYAPALDGDFSLTAASGTATGAEISVTASVSGTGSAAIDAANEATDAANAATDAANAAAEAADAATAAAQDAQSAVAALATQVSSLIAGIKAQITSLTNLVIKIQKKVRA